MNGKSRAIDGREIKKDYGLNLTYEATRFLLHSCCFTYFFFSLNVRRVVQSLTSGHLKKKTEYYFACKTQTWRQVRLFSGGILRTVFDYFLKYLQL